MFRRHLILAWLGIIFLSGIFLMGQDTWLPALECVDFEDPTLGSVYHLFDTFADSGADVTGRHFEWYPSGWTSGGYAEIVLPDWCDAGGSGQDLLINNINMEFDFPAAISKGLKILFAEHGGNVNLGVNGIQKNVENFVDLVGLVAGVNVTCTGPGCTGGGQGELKLEGAINEFYIGGQEFCIDNVCPIL
jgi:hypothetical protein